jgi:epoxyqueuosine reductase
VVDAAACIAYLTIEKRGDIPEEFHAAIGTNVFGCDECQQVCPYNAVAEETTVFADSGGAVVESSLDALSEMSDDVFLEATRGSAIRRCKAAGMRRNARIVRENVASGGGKNQR